jgi:hypothetical protein
MLDRFARNGETEAGEIEMIHSFQWNVGENDTEVTVQVDTYLPEKPAQTYGPAEKCYDLQPEVIEYTVIKKDGSEYKSLSDRDHEQIVMQLRDEMEALQDESY